MLSDNSAFIGESWQRDPLSSMRATPRKLVKTLFIVSMMGFLIVNMNFFLETRTYNTEENPVDGVVNGVGEGEGVYDNTFNRADIKVINLGAAEHMISNNKNKTVNGSSLHGTIHRNQHLQPSAHYADRNQSINNISNHLNHLHNNQNRTNHDNVIYELDKFVALGDNPEGIKAYIKQVNNAQKIRNLDKFDLPSSQNGVVIVVQVHDRTEYLKHVINAFREAKYIEQSLLIFSHDYFSDDINELVFQIDFCPVLQIFYPVPIQLYPHEFPGEDPGDCPRDSNRAQASVLHCSNAEWPDKYGHYREARYTQTKHHWFWKVNICLRGYFASAEYFASKIQKYHMVNHVFDHLEVTKRFSGPVLFVEDDHLVSEDFIHTLHKMYRFRDSSCKDCSILTLGTYLKSPVYGSYSKKGFWERLFGKNEEEPKRDGVEIMNWISSKHNMGMSFDRSVWEKIKHCAEVFCRFDDYNWDWSLQFVSQNCIQNKLRVMVMKSPRIFHIGECGMHKKGKSCDPASHVGQIKNLLNNNKQYLYPDSLEVQGYPRSPSKMPKPNGGWGDKRDHELCLHFATNSDLHR